MWFFFAVFFWVWIFMVVEIDFVKRSLFYRFAE